MPPSPEDQLPGENKRSPLGLPARVGDADPHKALTIWDRFNRNVHKAHGPQRPSFLGDMAFQTAILPYYWNLFPPDFTKYLKQEMFDATMTTFLEYERAMNWCEIAVHLYPLWAAGDGNCLLHAISLALWGVEDTDLNLRKLLYHVMKGEFAAENESRWRRERNMFDTMHIPGSGFRYNTKEWSAEWKMVVELSSPEPRVDQTMGLPYDCLEEFHIFIMANILRRPIIILAEDMWRDASGRSLQPLNFSGIYLPLAWKAKDCYRYPIMLGYHQMHFSPLVCTAPLPGDHNIEDYLAPLVDKQMRLLPVHFLNEEEEAREEQYLRDYLVVEDRVLRNHIFPFARLSTESPKPELDVFDTYLKLAEMRYRMYTEEQHNPENAEALKVAGIMSAANTEQINEIVAGAGLVLGDPVEGKHSRAETSSKKAGEDDYVPTAKTLMEHPHPPPVDDLYGPFPKRFTNPPPVDDLYDPFPKTFPGQAQRPTWKAGLHSEPTAGMPQPRETFSPRQTTLACKTSGCQYVRAAPTDDYCASCYKAHSAVGKASFKPCLTDSCLNGGEREYDGKCKVCYDQSKFMNDDTLAVEHASNPSVPGASSGIMELHARRPVQPELPAMEMEVEHSNANNLNTTVINAFTVGSKKCISPGCDFTGSPKFSGMCSKCYNIMANAEKETMQPWSEFKADSPPKEFASSVGKKKCVVPECPMTGHPETNDLCSGCFNKQTQLLEKTSKSAGLTLKTRREDKGIEESLPGTNVPESPYTLPADRQKQLWEQMHPPECRTPKCDMFGQPSQNGLCSRCYKLSLRDRSSTQSPVRTSKSRSHDKSSVQSSLQFTVQKNMCAVPGCNGVRIDLGDGDLCITHHLDRSKRYSPRVGAAGPPRAASQSVVPSTSRTSRTSAPPQSIGSSQPCFPLAAAASIPRERQTELVQSGKTQPGQSDICAHPKCNNLALPPLFVTCEDCLAFVERVKQLTAAYSLVRGEGSNSRNLGVHTPQPDEGGVPSPMECSGVDPDDMPADNLRNLDISEKTSPALKDKFQFDHIPRRSCTAVGGCPYKLYGDPSYGNLCSKCFDRDIVGTYSGGSNTAPMKKSAHQLVMPPRSRSEVISTTTSTSASRSAMTAQPSNFKRCSSAGCKSQANPNILEGYCNECYPAYQTLQSSNVIAKKKSSAVQHQRQVSPSPKPSSGARKDPARGQKMYPTETGSTVLRCLMKGCVNFGNSHCRGYCNKCFLKVMK